MVQVRPKTLLGHYCRLEQNSLKFSIICLWKKATRDEFKASKLKKYERWKIDGSTICSFKYEETNELKTDNTLFTKSSLTVFGKG